MMQGIKESVGFLRNLSGFRRLGVSFLFGALAGFAFPPFNVIPLAFVSFSCLVFILQGTARLGQAFWAGWFFALGLLIVCLHWIAKSMFVDLASFWWAVPLAVAGLPAAFSFYYGLAAMLARWKGVDTWRGILFFALCWFAADMARGHLFTGFPWDMTGYIWGDALPILQITSLIGIHGLTLLTLVLLVVPAMAVVAKRNGLSLLSGVVLVLGLIAGWGGYRLSMAPDEVVPDVFIRLVDPEIDQVGKWKRDVAEGNLEKLLSLSFAPSEKSVTHLIWPETATAYRLTEEPLARSMIVGRMPNPMMLLSGTIRAATKDAEKVSYYNSLIAMDHKGTITAAYDKAHLVPFGEYIPFRDKIPLKPVAGIGADFDSGEGPRSLRVAGLPPFSPLICYEAIFSGSVTDVTDPPQFLVNVTNDGWYEGTIGPWQHFMIARVRAIEEGLPLLRAANKGVTAIVDSYGKIRAANISGVSGVVDGALPLGAVVPSHKTKNLIWLVFLVVFTLCVFVPTKKK